MPPESNWLYDQIREQYNHYPLTDEAYNVLKDLEESGNIVRIAGKVLLVAGIALDALELGIAVSADLKDAERKLGKAQHTLLRVLEADGLVRQLVQKLEPCWVLQEGQPLL